MQILQLSSFPIEQAPNLDQVMQNLAAWFVSREFPVRLLAYSRPFAMRPAIERVQRALQPLDSYRSVLRPLLQTIDRLARGDPSAMPLVALRQLPPQALAELMTTFAGNPQLQQALALDEHTPPAVARPLWLALASAIEHTSWRLPWMKEMVRFYEAMEHAHVRSAEYLLVTHEPADVSAQALVASLRQATRRPVRLRDHLPGVINGSYREQPTRLKPIQPGLPWIAVLHAYDVQDDWDPTTLHALMARNYDISIAVDILTYPRQKAQRAAEMAFNASNLLARDAKLLDMRSAKVARDAQYALTEMHHQTLHEIQIAVAVAGRSADELETHAAEVRDLLVPRLRMLRARGCQGEILKLFSTIPRKRIDAPWKPRTQLSAGVGCMLGLIGYHRPTNTSGLFWGIDARRRAPIFVDLFQENQAAHITILGMSGHGKTVFMNVIAERAAAVAGMQVIGIDAFENGQRVAAALAGATCYRIGPEQCVNILDVVYGNDSDAWQTNQVGHVLGQLSLLLGQPTRSADGKERFEPRVFAAAERGVLDSAVTSVYQSHLTTPDTPIDAMPILSDLIRQLHAEDDEIATSIARDLTYLLFGRKAPPNLYDRAAMTTQGRSFNGYTTVDWHFGRDVTYYDFSAVGEIYRPFYYLQAIGAINRYLRRPGRDRSRKIFLQIDEFGYASQVEAVARLAVDICKTARKYGCGIMLVDQNPLTFLETDSGRQIIENAAARVYFHLEDIAARQVGDADSKLTPDHITWLPRAGPGECLTVIRNDVYQLNIELHPLEQRAFIGS